MRKAHKKFLCKKGRGIWSSTTGLLEGYRGGDREEGDWDAYTHADDRGGGGYFTGENQRVTRIIIESLP